MHLVKAWVLRREKNRNSIRWSEPHPQDVFTSVCCTAQQPFKCCHVDGAYDNIIAMHRHILTTCHYHFNAKYVINWVVHFETSLKVKPWQPTGSSWKCNWIIVATVGLCTIMIVFQRFYSNGVTVLRSLRHKKLGHLCGQTQWSTKGNQVHWPTFCGLFKYF